MTPKQRDNVRRLLAPRHIAFIGGSSAEFAAQQCAKAGFEGAIWGVNPKRAAMAGQPCFPYCDGFAGSPGRGLSGDPPCRQCRKPSRHWQRGVPGGVVVYTAGYGELGTEGAALERALVAAAGEMALVGPNCLGVLNYVTGAVLWPFAHGGKAVTRGMALVSQSGLLGTNLTMNQRAADFSYVVSLGNQASLGIEDFVDVLIEDPAVSAVGLYVEGLRDVPRFSAVALRALEMGKPIVALKAGSSEMGAKLTLTHTGSLSGSAVLYRAHLRALGHYPGGEPGGPAGDLEVLDHRWEFPRETAWRPLPVPAAIRPCWPTGRDVWGSNCRSPVRQPVRS